LHWHHEIGIISLAVKKALILSFDSF